MPDIKLYYKATLTERAYMLLAQKQACRTKACSTNGAGTTIYPHVEDLN
jgi:hypothetical protein